MGLAWLDRKHARQGWVGLLVAGAAVAAVIGIDYDYFSLADEAVVLPGRDWELSSGDLPRTWAGLEQSDTFQRVTVQAPEVRSWVETWIHKATGIRWTPSRWNLWFGRVVFVSGQGDAAVVSVRAKLLTRAAFAAARIAGLTDTHDEISRISGLYITHSGNFFLIGTSPEIVSRLRSTGGHWSSMGGRGISFDHAVDRQFGVYASADGEITASIWLDKVDHRVSTRADYFAIDWPEPPVVSVLTRGLDLNSIVPEDEWPEFPGSTELARTWKDFEGLLPEGWRAGADTTQFALFAVDTSGGIPVPDAAVFARSETSLGPLKPPTNGIAYEWSGTAGWMTPWLGEGANLFVVADDRSRVFTNQEATMEKLMARRRAGRIASDDARIEIDTARLAKVLTDLVRRAAKNELWPERNTDDVEQDVIPWLRGFGALGTIRFEGKYDKDGLVLRGGTHAPPAETPS